MHRDYRVAVKRVCLVTSRKVFDNANCCNINIFKMFNKISKKILDFFFFTAFVFMTKISFS